MNCTFDEDDCQWKFDNWYQIQWKRTKGNTGTTIAGPAADHTSGSMQEENINNKFKS